MRVNLVQFSVDDALTGKTPVLLVVRGVSDGFPAAKDGPSLCMPNNPRIHNIRGMKLPRL
jgi:hypothetical protein